MDVNKFIKYCEENGFFYKSSGIYGGTGGIYDYGSLGTLLKRNYENIWRSYFGSLFDNIYELDASNIMHKNVFIASGHIFLFNDPITECKNGHRFRADKLIEEKLGIKAESLKIDDMNKIFRERKILCPICNSQLSDVKQFNLMFPIFIGPEADLFLYLEEMKKTKDFDKEKLIKKYEDLMNSVAYLRPETAQSVYVNFANEIIIHRLKLPLGLYIIGKAFRNEISPRNALIRMREFTQAELQIFFDYNDNPFDKDYENVKNEKINVLLVKRRNIGKDFETLSLEEIRNIENIPKFYLYFLYKVFQFFTEVIGIDKNRVRFYQLSDEEKSFYNMYHFDLEIYLDDLGWVENGGVHFRAIKVKEEDLNDLEDEIKKDLKDSLVGYDLWNHFKLSKDKRFLIKKDRYFIPVELELSFGVDRNIFSILYLGYREDDKRIWLNINKKLAPIKIGIFPLIEKNNEHVKIARKIYEDLKKYYKVFYDDSGSIGRRYRRQDEIGTPFCVTVDDQTLKDNSVTVRFIEDMHQIRLKIDELKRFFDNYFS